MVMEDIATEDTIMDNIEEELPLAELLEDVAFAALLESSFVWKLLESKVEVEIMMMDTSKNRQLLQQLSMTADLQCNL